MSCKKQKCYEHVFKYIDEDICRLNGTFMTDYEYAMRNALAIQYPQAKLRCCWFHFCQAVKKKAAKLGLANLIRTGVLEKDIYIS